MPTDIRPRRVPPASAAGQQRLVALVTVALLLGSMVGLAAATGPDAALRTGTGFEETGP